MTFIKKFLNIFKRYEWLFLIIVFAVLISFAVIYNASWFEIVAPLFGVISASLNGKKKKYAFVTYSIYVVIYGIYCFLNSLYGEAILNVCINLPMYLWTLFKFYILPIIKKKKEVTNEENPQEQPIEKKSEFEIKSINLPTIIGIIIFVPVVTIVYGLCLANGFWISESLVSNYPYLNALATALCLVAVFLASKTILWQWVFWIAYAAICLVIWTLMFINFDVGALIIASNVCFLIINTYCFTHRIIDYRKQRKAPVIETENA